MDDKKGRFDPINDETYQEKLKEPDSGVFRVGEILEIRGSRLRVEAIKKKKLVLKLLKPLS